MHLLKIQNFFMTSCSSYFWQGYPWLPFYFLAITEANGTLKIFFHVLINCVLLQFILACLPSRSEAFKRFIRNQRMFSFVVHTTSITHFPRVESKKTINAGYRPLSTCSNLAEKCLKKKKVLFKIIIKKVNLNSQLWRLPANYFYI